MRILKKFLRILAIILPSFLGVFFFSSNSYALQDLTYTSTYSNGVFPSVGYLCGGGNVPSCSGYSYLLIETSFNLNENFNLIFKGGYWIQYIAGSSSMLFNLPSFYQLSFTGISKSGLSDGDTITFTVLDHNPYVSSDSPSGSITLSENGTYDVTSYAEAVVDVPPVTEPGDYDDEFNGVITAIYICGASALAIYFFYLIYGIIIKPTGGYK